MATLREQVEPKRPTVVKDLAHLVDAEVDRKGGLSGFGIKAAYGLVKAIKPGFIPDVIDGLFDEWVRNLEPLYAEAVAAGGGVAANLRAKQGPVADALLAVTDERAKKTTHTSARKAYEKLRPTAKKHVEEAVPALAALLEKHTQA